jgi:poly(glycerol-phosphate) alpha-glucosyltransferase
MKIGLVSDSLSSTAGGIFEIERSLALHLRDLGVGVTAWGAIDHRWADERDQWQDVECRVRNRLGPRIFGYVPGLLENLVNSDCDLLHLQHLWMYPSVAVHQWHRRTGKPFLVSANGMLEPWTLSRSRLNKRIAALLYEDRMLRRATCLQANTEKELADFRSYGLKNPVCLIPNGVDLPVETGHGPRGKNHGGARKRILLFLGRLHPKKGLVNTLRAWKEVTGHGAPVLSQEEWQFVIAGWDQGGHGEELKKLCTELGLSYADTPACDFLTKNEEPGTKHNERVAFVGPVFGEAKDVILQQADAFVLPSFSEGLPMAVLEAWAYRLPVLKTDHCNLPEGFAANAAIRVGTDTESIAEGMRELTTLDDSERLAMGEAGRALVEKQFTWESVATQMKEVYAWMLGAGVKPGCVFGA